MPEFFIIGAMKSGTSTLHQLLAQHPEVFIPDGEPHLFSIDDFDSFPQAQWDGELVEQGLEKYWDEYSDWYSELTAPATQTVHLGEDSAGYLSSKIAIDRLAKHVPQAKLLVVLRDPMARTYSHYWHWVRSGRAFVSFEDSLRFGHGNLLQRSYYEEQLRYCYQHFHKRQIKVLIFEEFIKNQEEALEEVFRFLGVPNSLPLNKGRHENRGQFPRSLSLKLFENYLFRRLFGLSYTKALPRLSVAKRGLRMQKWMQRVFRTLNPSTSRNHHQMAPCTRKWLKSWLYRKNSGLPKLLGMDLEKHWPTFRVD